MPKDWDIKWYEKGKKTSDYASEKDLVLAEQEYDQEQVTAIAENLDKIAMYERDPEEIFVLAHDDEEDLEAKKEAKTR